MFEYTFATGVFADIERQVVTALPSKSFTMHNAATHVIFTFEEELTGAEYTTLSGVVDAYDYNAGLLAMAKSVKNKLIDNRTDVLIARGFAFDDEHFSLSVPAQVKWLGLFTFRSTLAYPYPVTKLDDGTYFVADVDAMGIFAGTGVITLDIHITSGRDLKSSVNDCTTVDAVNAIEDNRV